MSLPVMIFDVKVLGVVHASDAATGDSVYQVTLGRSVKLPEARRAGTPHPPGAEPPKEMQVFYLVAYLPIEEECPYRAGSNWSLEVKKDGTMHLTPKKG
ncbi:MAG: hypothetical protein L3J96_01170 [Thermoplasmata archaeon]|nr:hypothetical protein [Thermoplasmata archaeon]